MTEIEIPGYPGYWATRAGEIRGPMGRILRPYPNEKGYLMVSARGRNRKVHKLVALAFHGPRPSGLEIRHLSGVRTDNRPDNLKYGTRSENALDAVVHGTHPLARQAHCKHGHEFTPENTHVRRDGKGRQCKACARKNNLKWLARSSQA